MKRGALGLLVLALSAGFAPAAAALSFEALLVPEAADPDDRAARETQMYDRGTRALDDGEWEEAVRSFRKAAEMGGARADGATYWVAYALNRQGRPDAALEILRGFASKYPKSTWRKEARALELEIQPGSGRTVLREDGNDEDLKLMALNSLMNTDPERALPLLEKVLNGSASPKLKERALFVLAQSSSPRGRDILASAARGRSGPDLQEKAIHYLGVFGGKGNAQLLSEIYDSSTSNEVKERVLHAFMVSGNRERVLAAARNEKSPALRSAAVHQLGVMGARTELWQMYRAESAESVKDSILQAMFIAGDVDHVLELARTEPSPALRRAAIHRLGLMDHGHAGPALLSIYQGEKDPEVRKAVLQGLFLQNNAHALVEIARTEKDPRMKAEAVSKLSIMHNKEATDYMLEILNR
ncbi:MAG: HEAT repeat domain-containing protein [Acidobacteria bacterium]|nr:HEAT repeat domain-containing protein [Acidobacteriota bacterium]